MHIDLSPEVLLSQLGYSKNTSSLEKASKVISNTKDFDKFSKHIVPLNDNIQKYKAYIALSNTKDLLKIKCDENDSKEVIAEFTKEILKWADKYNIRLKKVENKDTYYILGSSK